MNERIVQQTQIGDYMVSTVFLGINHNWGGGEPILYETMIFTDKEEARQQLWWEDFEDYQRRYHTKGEALEGHEHALIVVSEHLLGRY